MNAPLAPVCEIIVVLLKYEIVAIKEKPIIFILSSERVVLIAPNNYSYITSEIYVKCNSKSDLLVSHSLISRPAV